MPSGYPSGIVKKQIYCPHCMKTLNEDNYYTFKNGDKDSWCKTCRTLHINNWEPDTFTPILKMFDVPYIPAEWNTLRDRAYAKDPKKMTPRSVFGKYLSKMKLKQFKDFTWADTERLQEEARLRQEEHQKQQAAQMEEITKSYEAGELTAEQYQHYVDMNKPEEQFEVALGTDGKPAIFNSAETPFEKVDIPDVGMDLTDEDKIYLALKWGKLYTAADWVWLEQKYNDFMNSFDIQGAARIDTLVFICKTSLKMHQALDVGDIDTYQKLSKVYDAQMKAAKFTEAQRKEEKSGEFDSVGQIVYFCEKEGGKIPRYDTSPNSPTYDKIDEKIDNLKRYLRELVERDPTISQQIENYMKKKEISAEMSADAQYAAAQGLENLELSDEDFQNYNDFIESQKEADE